MRALAVFGGVNAEAGDGMESLRIDGMPVRTAIMDVQEPQFDPRDPASARQVLVRVSAFSCNYRDKGFIWRLQRFPVSTFYAIGSEFAGTVVEVGCEVRTLKRGDRVTGQNHYTGAGVNEDGQMEGLPTNQGSKEFQVLHESKLIQIPDSMTDVAAAAFSIGAQTSYSMVRKLDPRADETALVTSATSNTSLFLIAALKQRGVRVIATTGSAGFEDELREWGVDELVPTGGDPDGRRLGEVALRLGGFHHVFDPFFDLHLQRSVALTRPSGKYVTCGVFNQTAAAARVARPHTMDMNATMTQVMMKNLLVVGNCLGFREDLALALDDYAAGRFACMIDSVYTGRDAIGFLDRTFEDRTRLGKVVFAYDYDLADVLRN